MTPERLLSDLIQIPSVNPPGNETPVAVYLRDLFAAAGIPSLVVESEPGRGSFVATLGHGERRLLFLSHTDVVPAGEGWAFDPFGGAIIDGHVCGRGALDCKGLVAAQAAAVLRLAREGNLNGTLIFAATADEERGGKLGVQYLLEHHPELLRADFAINEGGEEPIVLDGRTVYFVQVGEKGTAWSTVTTRGVACHGSVPALGENAVVKMAGIVTRLAALEPPVRLIPEVAALVAELARLRGLEAPVAPENVDALIAGINDAGFAAALSAMTRMTLSPNVIQGGTKTNIVPDLCTLEVDVRILPGQDREEVERVLREAVGEDGEFEIHNYHPPTFSPAEAPYYRLIVETIGELVGPVPCLPHISPGATDSRHLRAAGIPAYGISLMAPGFDPRLRTTVHGRNERIDIASLRLKTEFFVRLARKYLG